jgi:predicted alpha/beta superfamily hydrolase
LSGTVQVERRFSAALDMERDLTLYLPPGHAVSGNYPVIYAADGEAVAGLAQVIEPLITAGSWRLRNKSGLRCVPSG